MQPEGRRGIFDTCIEHGFWRNDRILYRAIFHAEPKWSRADLVRVVAYRAAYQRLGARRAGNQTGTRRRREARKERLGERPVPPLAGKEFFALGPERSAAEDESITRASLGASSVDPPAVRATSERVADDPVSPVTPAFARAATGVRGRGPSRQGARASGTAVTRSRELARRRPRSRSPHEIIHAFLSRILARASLAAAAAAVAFPRVSGTTRGGRQGCSATGRRRTTRLRFQSAAITRRFPESPPRPTIPDDGGACVHHRQRRTSSLMSAGASTSTSRVERADKPSTDDGESVSRGGLESNPRHALRVALLENLYPTHERLSQNTICAGRRLARRRSRAAPAAQSPGARPFPPRHPSRVS